MIFKKQCFTLDLRGHGKSQSMIKTTSQAAVALLPDLAMIF
jgi:alpha-beta hydrolase superfamily lysophospholipase